jgi:hypothetical protein
MTKAWKLTLVSFEKRVEQSRFSMEKRGESARFRRIALILFSGSGNFTLARLYDFDRPAGFR